MRFVVLYHEMPRGAARRSHWDFMLERSGVLWTWALPRQPVRGEAMDVEALPDHRLAYLDYEGEVSLGRGAVTRWDRGDYEVIDAPGGAADADRPPVMRLRLHGEQIAGEVLLTRLESKDRSGSRGDQSSRGDQWIFVWKGN